MSTSLRFRSRQGENHVEHSSIQRWQSAISSWSQRLQGSLSRYVPHLVVILAAIVVFSSNPLQLDDIEGYDLPQHATPTAAPPLGFRVGQEPLSGRGGFRGADIEVPASRAREVVRRPAASFEPLMNADLLQSPVAHTTIPERLRREVITYVVQRGDTVLGIASQSGLSPETVMWANGDLERNPDLLRPGQELIILPIDGVYHTIIKGDTLLKIAKTYQVEVDDIVHCVYNELDPEDPQIAPGQNLVVPGGIKPYIPRQVTAYKGPIPTDAKQGTGVFKWPASGRISDRFGFRTYSGRWHTGLDIAAYTGAPIYASDSGFVTFAGWTDQGYGKLVIIDHGNGFVTYYGHVSVCYVSAGQSVGQGALIAAMGSTGNSTGPHLHFEIRNKGVQKNPELYLP